MEFSDITYYLLQGLYWYLVLASIIVVLLENRNPVRTTSWVLVLAFVPYLGLFLYFIFGRSFHRQGRLSRKMRTKVLKDVEVSVEEQDILKQSAVSKNIELVKLLEGSNDAGLFANNDIKIYTKGNELFQSMMEEIEKATDHIHAEYYIVETDETGNAFKDALIKKAKEGVVVRLIYDDLGSWRLKQSTIREMKHAGIRLQSFFKLRFPYFTSKLNYRNHRKVLVIDGRVGFLGGFNVADRYTKGLEWGSWRDTHIKYEGDGVAALQGVFLTDWWYITKRLHQQDKFFPPPQLIHSHAAVQIVESGPDTEWQAIMQGFCQAIHQAKEYIYIQTPYFLPNESIKNAIESAALRGVDVRLMIPSRSDSRLSFAAAMSYLLSLLESKVKIYQYQKGFIHSKTIVIDDNLAIIGSANLDFRSFEQNFEVSAFIYDEAKSIELKAIFINDTHSCRRYRFSDWNNRSILQKMWQALARLFSPVL